MQICPQFRCRGFEFADQAFFHGDDAVIFQPFAICVIDLADQWAIAIFGNDEMHLARTVWVMPHKVQQFARCFVIWNWIGNRANRNKGIMPIFVRFKTATQVIFGLVGVKVFMNTVWCIFPNVQCHAGNSIALAVTNVTFVIGGFFVVVMFLNG